jgi:uncharacterized membrane protein
MAAKRGSTLSFQQIGAMLAALAVTYFVAANHATLARTFQKNTPSK